MNFELLEKFPPRNDKDLFDTLQFIKKSPIAKDYWKVLKSLYKQSETAFLQGEFPELSDTLINLLSNLIIRLDQVKIKEITSPYPTHATVRYMKRRARRFLRKIAEVAPEPYFKIASKVILANENLASLDFDNQWITIDLILGNSRRVAQRSNGYGGYNFDSDKYQLHQREERFPQIWDEQSRFLQDLLVRDMPWQIHEFAIKALSSQNLPLPEVSQEVLVKFFNAPSHWLKRIAVNFAYKTYTFQSLKPAVFAGMWLYCSAGLRKKIQEIQNNRTRPDRAWQEEYAQNLANFTFKELKQGTSSRRILQSVEYLQKEYAKLIPTDNLLPMAEALFHSPYKSLQELAFLGAEKAPKQDTLAWLSALDNGKEKLSMPQYDRLALILFPKFKGDMQVRDVEPFVFNASFACCDFGWRLSAKIRHDYSLYSLWYNLSMYDRRRKMKQIYFHNAITSMAGADSFIRYYNYSQWYLTYYSDDALAYLMNNALDRIKSFVLKQFAKNFKDNPLYNLNKIAGFPPALRDQVVEEGLKGIEQKIVFDYYWYVQEAFRLANTNEWIADTVLKLVQACKMDTNSASTILNQALPYEKGSFGEKLMQIIGDWKGKRYEFFVEALGHNYRLITEHSALLPKSMVFGAVAKMNLENLLELTAQTSDVNWQALSEVIYEQLLAKSNEIGFWKNILEKIINGGEEKLNIRLIQDAKFFALFQQQKDLSIIDISQPEYEEVIYGWLQANPQYFSMDSGELFKVCIHKLPKLRTWGLELARNQGITLPFGLQLFESDLPDAVEEAKNYFNSLKPKSEKELESALAMCDSPNKVVRAFGLDYVANRKENFSDNAQILEFLSEHSDKFVQQYVAEEIQKSEVQKPFVQRFDKEILRMKNRSRKAKENVKQRIEQTLVVENSTLLELAKTGNKLDKEWAIAQLTKKVLAGEEILGFELV